MLKFAYIFSTLFSILEAVIFFEQNSKNVKPRQLLLFLFSCTANYGYALGAFSDGLDGLLIGNQIYYLGSLMTMIFLVFAIAELCYIKIPIYLRHLLFLYGVFIVVLVATSSSNSLYYASIKFGKYKGLSYLIKEYGILHVNMYILIYGCDFLSLIFLVKALFFKKNISSRTVAMLFIMMILGTGIYAVSRYYKIPFEMMPFIFNIVIGSFIFIFRKAKLYDMSETISFVSNQKKEVGYISFDMKKRYMGSNCFARQLFPEIADQHIDKPFKKTDSQFYSEIITWLENWNGDSSNVKIVKKDKISLSCSIRYIKTIKNIGFIIEMKDDTLQQNYIDIINGYNAHLEKLVIKKTNNIQNIQDSIVKGMAIVVESRDNSTGGHINRTSTCVKLFVNLIKADSLYAGYDEKFYSNVIKAAPMHDLGKIAVDDSILKKPGRFTDEEYEKMKKHPSEGARIVSEILREVNDEELKKIAVNIAQYHHEKWDGTGYPRGLEGIEIPFEARIMAIADVFDALVSKRCYKEPFSYDVAFSIISDSLGKHFDPELCRIFIENRKTFEDLYDSYLNEN